jgi:hypothetical protein
VFIKVFFYEAPRETELEVGIRSNVELKREQIRRSRT